MSNYLITLTPVDKFFFGGDMTFNVHGDADHNEKFGTYIIRSAMFPQQTSLLGMLRFLLLRSDKSLFDGQSIIPGTSAKVTDLIGPSSFTVKAGGKNDSCFGKILKLHRCFVRCKDSDSVHNLDFLGFDHDVCGDAEAGNVGYVNGRRVILPAIGGYNPKNGYKKVIRKRSMKCLWKISALESSAISLRERPMTQVFSSRYPTGSTMRLDAHIALLFILRQRLICSSSLGR